MALRAFCEIHFLTGDASEWIRIILKMMHRESNSSKRFTYASNTLTGFIFAISKMFSGPIAIKNRKIEVSGKRKSSR